MQGNAYAFGFTTAVCVTCALLVSSAASGWKHRQDVNQKIDMHKNVLEVVGLKASDQSMTTSEIQQLYDDAIVAMVVDSKGNIVPETKPADIDSDAQAKLPADSPERLYPLYEYRKAGAVVGYCIPISGKGLWSTLYGFFALERDADTVLGITFYKQGETPGLGAEIAQSWFKDQFKGKRILDAQGDLESIQVVKGKAPPNDEHAVDGISGATITSRGVATLLKADLERYQPFLEKIWKREGN